MKRMPCKVKINKTGKVIKFNTLSGACRFLETPYNTIYDWFARWKSKGKPQTVYENRAKEFTITLI